jgi:ABC-type antimicrobial peptide transport system permease subunit
VARGRLKDDVVERVASLLWVLMATIGIVMLIACANVGNLVLVRSEARQQEFAVQMALGSGRPRLIAGWLVESLVLSVLGGALGTALAYPASVVLKAFAPANIPPWRSVAVDGRVLAFALAVSILSGICLGLIPALKSHGRQLSGMLAGARGASDGRDRQRTRNGWWWRRWRWRWCCS